MENTYVKVIAAALICTALSAATGILLSRTVKPYGTVIFTLHKLSALGIVILLTVICRDLSGNSVSRIPVIIAAVSAYAAAAVLFITGAVMSIRPAAAVSLSVLHKASTFISAAAMAGVIILWLKNSTAGGS